jgi:hypothetical protein
VSRPMDVNDKNCLANPQVGETCGLSSASIIRLRNYGVKVKTCQFTGLVAGGREDRLVTRTHYIKPTTPDVLDAMEKLENSVRSPIVPEDYRSAGLTN